MGLQESGYPLSQQQKVLGRRDERWRTVVSCWADTGFSLLVAVAAADSFRAGTRSKCRSRSMYLETEDLGGVGIKNGNIEGYCR